MHRAEFARRSVKDPHRRRERRALPECIKTAPPQAFAFVAVVTGESRKGHVFIQTVGLIRFDRRPADLLDQQSRDKERLVADHLRRQSETRAARKQPVVGITLLYLWR